MDAFKIALDRFCEGVCEKLKADSWVIQIAKYSLSLFLLFGLIAVILPTGSPLHETALSIAGIGLAICVTLLFAAAWTRLFPSKSPTSSRPVITQLTQNQTGKIYIVKGEKFYKIGLTRGSVESRLKSLQTGSPASLKLVHVIETKDPEKLERELHRVFAHKRVQGEWFALEDTDLDTLRRIRG